MPTLTLSQIIDRPTADVFRTLADVGNLAQWNPTITGSRKLSDGPAASGTRFEMTIRGFGNVPQTLEEFELNRQLRYVPHFKTFVGGHRFKLIPEGPRTRVEHELEMTPQGWFRVFGPFMGLMGRKNLRATAEALKRFVEGLPTRG